MSTLSVGSCASKVSLAPPPATPMVRCPPWRGSPSPEPPEPDSPLQAARTGATTAPATEALRRVRRPVWKRLFVGDWGREDTKHLCGTGTGRDRRGGEVPTVVGRGVTCRYRHQSILVCTTGSVKRGRTKPVPLVAVVCTDCRTYGS